MPLGVVINRDSKSVAALIGACLFERIRRMQTRFDALCKRIQASYAGVMESEGMTEVDNAVAHDREQQRRSCWKWDAGLEVEASWLSESACANLP